MIKLLQNVLRKMKNASVDKDDGTSKNEIVKVLGLSLHTDGDYFTFQFDDLIKLAKSLTLTKTNVPLFGGSFMISLDSFLLLLCTLKMFFQELCIEKAQWDSPLTETHKVCRESLLHEIDIRN